jgi:hypothetical protein
VEIALRRRAVNKLTFLLIPYLLLTFSAEMGQHKLDVTPPPSLENSDSTRADAPSSVQRRIDLAELQKEADDLARTAQTIPSDVASVRKGALPKDFIQKLKQIEKLSKHLRSQIVAQ